MNKQTAALPAYASRSHASMQSDRHVHVLARMYAKGFHVNWWDRSRGAKRSDWVYGANQIEGGTLDQFRQVLQHFPSN